MMNPLDSLPKGSWKTEVNTVLINILEQKLDDALLKIIERPTADLIVKLLCADWPESSRHPKNLKRVKGDYRIKREQVRTKHDSTYSQVSKEKKTESAASGSTQPPPKYDDQSSKKPRESDASASKQHPALTSTGWQITDTRDDVVNSSMPRSDTESDNYEQSSEDIPMLMKGDTLDLAKCLLQKPEALLVHC
ncbi:hypothetical protein Tco_0271763 [Tanacetum coccineum]